MVRAAAMSCALAEPSPLGVVMLPAAQRERIASETARLADRGLRVLGVAKARHRSAQGWPDIQHDFDFEWIGLIGLADPLRAEVPEAMAQCRRAGIRVIMITGDHPRTAVAIANQAGIETQDVLTGDEMAGLDAQALARRVATVDVFARVRPEQKLALVEALKAQGGVVAMTAGGVNGAPALRREGESPCGQHGRPVVRSYLYMCVLSEDEIWVTCK